MFQAVGHHTFMLPCEMDYATLACYAYLVKLLMFVSIKMVFSKNEKQHNHIIILYPHFFYGCSELRISIVEGAHPLIQAMQFTKEILTWCCCDETQTKFEGFAFFPGKSIFTEIIKNGLGLCRRSKIPVCLAKKSMFYTELCWKNIAMGNVISS